MKAIMKRLIRWMAKKELSQLQRELDAAVAYHANYRRCIDEALGQPRGQGDILCCHVDKIHALRKAAGDE